MDSEESATIEHNGKWVPLYTEAEITKDLIIGNFPDKNIDSNNYKHIMGYKWALKNCLQATYILKTNDHIFVDTFQVSAYRTC